MPRDFPRRRQERVYVKVTSCFDPTGYMQPCSITWENGRTYTIDCVRDFRPAEMMGGLPGDCYTVVIRGQEKQLYFERMNPTFKSRLGRWFVLAPVNG